MSSELGYTKRERDINVGRIAFVASELTKAGAGVICSAIAPYEEARELARSIVSQYGGFFLIHINTPLEDCARRDTKKVYLRARNGEIEGKASSLELAKTM